MCHISVKPTGAKLDKSQYVMVTFTPDEEVDGVRVRPLPPASQPKSQYAIIKVGVYSIVKIIP